MYEETTDQAKQRSKAFTYHPPHGNQADRFADIRKQAHGLSDVFNRQCPPSRELSLAQTKLEEAVMWANAAIARNEVSVK